MHLSYTLVKPFLEYKIAYLTEIENFLLQIL